MKFKNIGIILLILSFLFAIAYFVRTNSKSAIEYETTNPFISSIELTSVVTGKVIPEDEVEIKPQLNGIIEKILVEEGDTVQNGQLIAVIKVVPDERSVYGAQAQVTSSKLNLENGEKGKIKVLKRSSEGKRFSRFVNNDDNLEIFLKQD